MSTKSTRSFCQKLVWQKNSGGSYILLSPYLCFICFLYLDLYVLGDDVYILGDKFGVFHANQTYMCLDPHLN